MVIDYLVYEFFEFVVVHELALVRELIEFMTVYEQPMFMNKVAKLLLLHSLEPRSHDLGSRECKINNKHLYYIKLT